jgi:hypothetical protein
VCSGGGKSCRRCGSMAGRRRLQPASAEQCSSHQHHEAPDRTAAGLVPPAAQLITVHQQQQRPECCTRSGGILSTAPRLAHALQYSPVQSEYCTRSGGTAEYCNPTTAGAGVPPARPAAAVAVAASAAEHLSCKRLNRFERRLARGGLHEDFAPSSAVSSLCAVSIGKPRPSASLLHVYVPGGSSRRSATVRAP